MLVLGLPRGFTERAGRVEAVPENIEGAEGAKPPVEVVVGTELPVDGMERAEGVEWAGGAEGTEGMKEAEKAEGSEDVEGPEGAEISIKRVEGDR